MQPDKPVHFRIWVYDGGRPPADDPVPVSLCPSGRRKGEDDSGIIADVTCPACLRHIEQLGVDWA